MYRLLKRLFKRKKTIDPRLKLIKHSNALYIF